MQLTSFWLNPFDALRAGDAVPAVSSAAVIVRTATAPQRLDVRLMLSSWIDTPYDFEGSRALAAARPPVGFPRAGDGPDRDARARRAVHHRARLRGDRRGRSGHHRARRRDGLRRGGAHRALRR